MEMFGFDSSYTPKIRISCKQWDAERRAVSIVLYSFGTIPRPSSICPGAHESALDIVLRLIQGQIDSLTIASGAKDLKLVAAKISDALQDGNKRIRELGRYIGEGIYMGGAVCCMVDSEYLALPFGGCPVYTWDAGAVGRVGAPAAGAMATDALGSTRLWSGQAWKGSLNPGGCLLTMSDPPQNLNVIVDCMKEGHTNQSHPNTAAVLLRRTIQHEHEDTAVAELRAFCQ